MNSMQQVPSYQPVEPGEGQLIDLHQILGLIRAYWLLIVITVVVCLAAAVAAYKFTPPSYSASAGVEVTRRSENLVPQQGAPPALTTDSSAVDTEAQRLHAPEIALDVARKLNLGRDPKFAGDPADGSEAAISRAARALFGQVQVARLGTSFTIQVTATAGSAQQAADFANAWVDSYRGRNQSSGSNEQNQQVALLRQKADAARASALAADHQVAEYKIANRLADTSKDLNLSQQEIGSLTVELNKARSDLAAKQASLDVAENYLRTGRDPGALGEALNSPVVTDLRRQALQLEIQFADAQKRYKPDHPDYQRAEKQLAAAQQSVNSEVARIRSNLRSQAQAAAQQVAELASQLNRAEGGINQQTAATAKLTALSTDAQSANDLATNLLNKYNAAAAEEGVNPNDLVVFTRAFPPSAPTWPNLILFLAAGFALGMLLSLLMILAMRLLRNGIETSADVEAKLGTRLISSIPDLSSLPGTRFSKSDPVMPSQYILENPGSGFAEAIRGFRNVLLHLPEDQKVVAITSALPSEGKTTLAMCVARSAGKAGRRVLLIDTDLRRRASTRNLANQVKAGLVEVLEGTVPLESALVQDSQSGAYLLPQTAASAEKYDALNGENFSKLLARIRDNFDLIVLDCAPTLAVAESRIAAGCADVTYLAVRWRKTPPKAANLALDKLEQSGVKLGGVVLTLVNVRQQAREGSGEGAFYKAYQSYYATA